MENINVLEPETKGLINDFINRYANLQLEKKRILADVKELKKEFDEQGLPTGQVIKAFNAMSKELRDGQDAITELEIFKDFLYQNKIVHDIITQLIAK